MSIELNPAIMGAIEKKIVEGILRLTEAHRMLNHLKLQNGFECIRLEDLAPYGDEDGKDKDQSKAVCSIDGKPKDDCET